MIAAGVTGSRWSPASRPTGTAPAYYEVPWRGRKATELGGAIISHVIHAHDLLTFTLGPVRRVFARLATRVNPIETEDCAAIVLEMASGALVTSSVTLGAAEELSKFRFCFADLTAESPGTPPYRPAEGEWRFIPRGQRGQAEIDAALRDFVPRQEGFLDWWRRCTRRWTEARMAVDLAGCLSVAGVDLGHLLQRGERHRCRIAAAAKTSRARWLGRLADVTRVGGAQPQVGLSPSNRSAPCSR